MRHRWLWALAVLVVPTWASAPVRVELRTSWSRPPFFAEMLETIASEVDNSFFTLLNALTDPTLEPQHTVKSSDTPKQIYDLCIWTALQAGFLWETGLLADVEMNLALHSALPRIEAAYQYYMDREAARAGECESWVDWYGQVVCDAETLKSLLEVETIDPSRSTSSHSTFTRPRRLPFDHVQPTVTLGLHPPQRAAVLYGSLSSANFRELHELLWHASQGSSPHVEYIFRHAPPTTQHSNLAHLSGYGAALDLKKMEYLALDDRAQGRDAESRQIDEASETVAESDPIVALVQQYPEDAAADYSAALTEDELLQIGFQTAQLLHDSENALDTLVQISQNFPKYASAVARRVITRSELEEEVQSNHAKAHPGVNMVWLNGMTVAETEMNALSLLRLMKKERSVMRATEALGLTPNQAIELLTHRAIGLAQSDSGVLDGICDASDRPEGGDVIVWWNNIETDKRYQRWNPAISMLLAPMYPGQLPNVKINLFNIILVLDLSQSSSVTFISNAVNMIINRGFPFRFGVVPLVESEQGAQMARLFYWMVKHIGRAKTMHFFSKISQTHLPMELLTFHVDWKVVKSEFELMIAEREEVVAFDTVINTAESNEILDKIRQYARRLSVDLATASQGHAFVNGKHFDLNDEFLRNMQMEAGQQLQHLQEQVYNGEITDENSDRMSTYFYDLPGTSKRRNRYIHPNPKPGQPDSLRITSLMDLVEKSKFPFSSGSFLHPPNSGRLNVTTIVITDLDSSDGIALVKEVLRSMNADSGSRYTFVHNSAATSHGRKDLLSSILGHLIMTANLKILPPAQLLDVLEAVDLSLREVEGQTSITLDSALSNIIGVQPLLGSSSASHDQFVRYSSAFVQLLKLSPGEQALVVNGRVVGPFARGEFVADDFEDLVTYEIRKHIGPVVEALTEIMAFAEDYDQNTYNGLVTMASSLVSSIHLPDPSEVGLFNTPIRPRRRNYQLLAGNYTKYEYGDSSTAPFHFGILLDPLSEAAQKWSALLQWLLNSPGVFVELHVNPPRYKDLPLKRFYRYNLKAVPEFDDQGEVIPSVITFNALPQEPIYTLAMDVPPSWHVRPREASHDLDNILLSGLSQAEQAHGVHASFSLDYLVIEGHAREDQLLQPPRGLQLQLVTSNSTPVADTLVVANLGYHQFRAKPGVYQFEIRPGRGQEIFRLSSVGAEGWDSPGVDVTGSEVTLMNFEGLTLYPRMVRLPGMESADVLMTDALNAEREPTFMEKVKHSVTSLFVTKEGSTDSHLSVNVTSGDLAEINIFTVASGLLYERFASIMILSVLRNTKSTVKFWFIENFLSPSFLEFIPHFAEAYGFKYELVTYKWPSWLRAQKEKQRIIWAYKILFLDVLFPMDLTKVIFVDADQIVRADLKELVDLDLHGAPYGYTPMGDDNLDMEGFRFWKTGYWKDFLKGLPYHISALYVVDLVRFRQIAAGDILRTHYQQLSADPHSLANLDQDLPNNLQREVPIFSLPEDWLWCETWCSKDRLDRAKTIDLCQNPLTKEPKLVRAKHIPEWEEYDSEIAQFAHQLSEQGIIHSGMVDADASVLADTGSQMTQPQPQENADERISTQPVNHHPKDEL